MKPTTLLTILVLAFAVTGASRGAQQQGASFSGVVRNAETGKPLSRVTVMVGDQRESITTDETGAFSFTGLPAGRQRVRALRYGYVLTGLYAPHISKLRFEGSNGLALDFRAGEILNLDLAVSIAPEVSGIVLDNAGEPLPKASIWLYERIYDAIGQQSFRWLPVSALTDDRGEFRLNVPAPGEYLVAAEKAATTAGHAFPLTFYPAGSDIDGAERLTFSHGESIQLRPLIMNPRPVGLLRLSMVDNEGNPYPGYVGFDVRQRTEYQDRPPIISGSTGLLASGVYEVQGTAMVEGSRDLASPMIRSVIVGYATAEVADKEVSLVLRPSPSARVDVLVRKRDSGKLIGFDGPPVALLPMTPNLRPFGPAGNSTSFGMPHGTYRIQAPVYGDLAGRNWLTDSALLSLPPDACLSEILHDGAALSSDLVTVSGSATTLTVVFENSTTRIRGKAVDAANLAAAGAIVSLVPDDGRPLAYSVTSADQDGLFEFRCARPGGHRIYAWTALPEGAHRNAAFMKRFEERGTAVRVADPADEVLVQTTVIEP